MCPEGEEAETQPLSSFISKVPVGAEEGHMSIITVNRVHISRQIDGIFQTECQTRAQRQLPLAEE